MIAYASRSLSRQERRYCVTHRELLAIVEFVQHFRQYLLGRQFTLRTDHGSLVWIRNFKEPEGQVTRWLERLAEYDFAVVHRRRALNIAMLTPCRDFPAGNMVAVMKHRKRWQLKPDPSPPKLYRCCRFKPIPQRS